MVLRWRGVEKPPWRGDGPALQNWGSRYDVREEDVEVLNLCPWLKIEGFPEHRGRETLG